MDWAAVSKLIADGGSVLIAVVVLAALLGAAVYFGHRFLYLPSQRLAKAIAEASASAAEANANAAKAHQAAAEANEQAARFNAETSQQNARTAAHLERLTELFLAAVVRQK